MSNRVRIRGMAVGAAVALAAWAAPAAAQGDPQAQLRQAITDVTAFFAAQTGGEATLQTSRPPEMRMDGGSAVATLPDFAIVGRRPTDRVDFGTLTLTQREVAPGRLRYELGLPESIRIGDAAGPVTIASRGGALTVVRDLASGLFYEVDFNLSEVRVAPRNPTDADVAIGRLHLSYAITGRADGLSDAVSRFALNGLRVVAARNMGGSAGEISMAFGVQAVRAEDIERIRAAFYEPAANIGDRWLHAFDRARALVTEGGVGGSTVDITVADGVYNDGNPQPAVTLTRATAHQVMTDTNQESGTYELQYQQQGLVLRQGLVPLPQYVPGRINLSLQLEDLPMRALHAYSAASMPSAAGGPPANPMPALMALVQAMQQAETTLHIQPIDVDSPAVGATLNGTVTADANAPFQAHASGELVVRGLEALQRELGAQGGRAGPDSPAGVVAMLVALGQQGTGANGQPVRTYRIELTPGGQLMLNGADMSALLGIGGPPGGGRPPARPAPQAPARSGPTGPAPQAPSK